MKANIVKIYAGILAAAVCLGRAGQARAFWTPGGQGGGALEQLGIAAEAGEPGGPQADPAEIAPAPPGAELQPAVLGRLNEEIEGLYKKTLPSVAALWIYDVAQTRLDEYGDDAAAANLAGKNRNRVAVGSGFVMDPRGFIGTNWHVAKLAAPGRGKAIVAELSDNSMVPCFIVGGDDKRDMAVLMALREKPFTPVKFGDSDKLQVGESVFATGTPFFGKFNFTWGRVTRFEPGGAGGPLIQMDAAINPGNSGGPLFNRFGEIVGVNTAIQGGHAFAGIGLAIPINSFNKFVSGLEAGGAMQKALKIKSSMSLPRPAAEQEYQTPLDPAKQTMRSILGPDWEARLAEIMRIGSRDGHDCKEAALARLAVEQGIVNAARPAAVAAQVLFAMENFASKSGLSLREYRSAAGKALYFIAEPAQSTPGAMEEKRTLGYQCVRIVNAHLRNYLGLPQKEIYSFDIPGFDSRLTAKAAMPPTEMLGHVVDFRNYTEDTMKAVVDGKFYEGAWDVSARIGRNDKLAEQLRELVVRQFGLHYLRFIVDEA